MLHHFKDIDIEITRVIPVLISSRYGSGSSMGQPLGVKSLAFVYIETNSGHFGVGETYAGVYVPEMVKEFVDYLAPNLVGLKLNQTKQISHCFNIPFIGRHGLLKSIWSGFEIALVDLLGKIHGKSSKEVLGFTNEKFKLYASGGSAACSVDDLSEEIASLDTYEDGFKMRAGFQTREADLARIDCALAEAGSKHLMVDFIMGTNPNPWDLTTSIDRISELDDRPLYWIEEPTPPDQFLDMVELKRNVRNPIAAGEAYNADFEFNGILGNDCVDFFQIDATHTGGISKCVSLIKRSQDQGIKNAMHVWGSVCALSANYLAACSSDNVDYLEYPLVSFDINKDLLVSDSGVRENPKDLFSGDGLGIRFDLDEIVKKHPFIARSGYALAI